MRITVQDVTCTHIIGTPGKRGPSSSPLSLISNPFSYHFKVLIILKIYFDIEIRRR